MDNKTLKRLQKEELTILLEVDRICKKNNIKYSLAYGTAIGAVRHGGFIPWDDDIDIVMTIDNYRKFQSVVLNEINQEKFYYQTYTKEKYGFVMWDKIRLNNTTSIVKGYENIPIQSGICIDIFPLSKYPTNPKLQKKHFKLMKFANMLLEFELYKAGIKKVNLKGKVFYSFICLLPRKIRKMIISLCINKVLNYDGEYENYVEYSSLYSEVLKFPKNIFNKTVEIKFENYGFPIMKNYKQFLRIVYGDYMKLPPKDQRGGHGNLIIDFNKNYNGDKNV